MSDTEWESTGIEEEDGEWQWAKKAPNDEWWYIDKEGDKEFSIYTSAESNIPLYTCKSLASAKRKADDAMFDLMDEMELYNTNIVEELKSVIVNNEKCIRKSHGRSL